MWLALSALKKITLIEKLSLSDLPKETVFIGELKECLTILKATCPAIIMESSMLILKSEKLNL